MTQTEQRKKWTIRKKVQRLILLENRICDLCGTEVNLHRHHIDGNRENNSIENFQILCQTCHIKKHLELGTWTESNRYVLIAVNQ